MNICHSINKCYEYVTILSITLLSMFNSHRPKVTKKIETLILFLQNLSYVTVTVYLLKYLGINNELNIVIAYAIGRWSFLLDEKIKEFLHKVTIIGIWREFTSWKK